MIWKLIAWARGFRSARDVETDALIVFRESDGVWFNASDYDAGHVWKVAATYATRLKVAS